MAKFTVRLSRDVTEYGDVVVDAEDEEAAEHLVESNLSHYAGEADWQEADDNEFRAEVNDVFETEDFSDDENEGEPNENAARFVLEIELGNEACHTGEDVATLLYHVANALAPLGEDEVPVLGRTAIRDRNGNCVGTWRATLDNGQG